MKNITRSGKTMCSGFVFGRSEKRKSWLFATLILFISSTKAQDIALTGKVRDEKTSVALEGASIALFNAADSSLITNSITKKEGVFTIGKVKQGNYYLVVKYIGYQLKKITDVNVATPANTDIGVVTLLSADNEMQTVTVSVLKLSAQNLTDKQSYKADQFLSAKGGTATDILRNLPSVSVNSQGQITVRGLTGFQVQLNGKPVRADVEAILSQIAANDIENVELITAPSAKYDADGKGGIINIVTKKGVANGLSVTANLQQGLPSIHLYNNKVSPLRTGGDVALNYQQNKWTLSGSINYLRNDASGYREGNANTTINNVLTGFPSNGERSFKRYTYGARGAVTYNADEHNSFSIGAYAAKRFQARTADLLYNNTRVNLANNAIVSQTTYFNSNLQTKEGNFYLGNFDYSHAFQNKSVLTASLLYEYDDLYGNTKNLNQYYPRKADTLQYTYNTTTNPLHGYRALLNYAYSIGSVHFESGYQYRYDKQDGSFVYKTNILHTNNYVIDPAFSSGVLTANTIHSVYTQINGHTNRLQYAAGLRYENSVRDLSFTNNAAAGNTLKLSNLFPSASILYSISNKLKIKSAYSRRVQRTSNYELNPFPEREHSETLEQGDANLLPEFTDLAELGVIKDYKGGSAFATLYYQQTKNQIQRVNSIYNDTILNRIYTNAGTAKQWGLELGSTVTPLKWLKVYVGANAYHYSIRGSLFHDVVPVDNKSWVYSLKTNLDFTIAPTITAQLNVSYLSRRATAQGQDSYFLSPNSSLRKTFLKGRLAAVLQWQNMDMGLLRSSRQKITTWGKNFYTTTNYIVETDVVVFNLSFNLRQNNKKIKLPASEFGEKEF